jgi:hypothetical protein
MAPTTARGTSHRFRCPNGRRRTDRARQDAGPRGRSLGGTGPHGPTASEARPVHGVLGHRTAASSDVRCRCGARPRPSRPGLWIRLLGETTGQPTVGDRPSADPGARREHGKGRPARPRAPGITARVCPFRDLTLGFALTEAVRCPSDRKIFDKHFRLVMVRGHARRDGKNA